MADHLKVECTSTVRVNPRTLAATLIDAGPDAFAHFWFCFAEMCAEKRVDLAPFGKAMAPTLGSMRQMPLRIICQVMDAEIYEISKKSKDHG